MSKVVDILEKIERKLSREYGAFTLFALFDRQDIPSRWDLVVAAPWVEQDNELAMKLLAQELKTHLPKNELERVSRIVLLDPRDDSVRALTAEHAVEHGRVEIDEGSQYGLPAEHGFVITSRRAA